MEETKKTLSPLKSGRQDKFIVALLEHPTHEKAAAALGVSDVTLWRHLQKPEFAEAYRRARRDFFSQSIARLQHAANAAVGTLLRVMTDREAPAASRVRAADVVLQTALRGMEMEDIEARVAPHRLNWFRSSSRCGVNYTGVDGQRPKERYSTTVLFAAILQGSWDPEIADTFEFSLSDRACESFVRLQPGQPIVERDYYLSKLVQFLKLSVDEALKHAGKWQNDPNGWMSRRVFYRAIVATLDEIHPSLIAHLRYFDWFSFQQDLIRCADEERMRVLLSGPFDTYLKSTDAENSSSRARLAKERKKLQNAYKIGVPKGTLARVRMKAKNVDARDFRRWQQGILPEKSVITKRIERAFNEAISSAAKSRA